MYKLSFCKQLKSTSQAFRLAKQRDGDHELDSVRIPSPLGKWSPASCNTSFVSGLSYPWWQAVTKTSWLETPVLCHWVTTIRQPCTYKLLLVLNVSHDVRILLLYYMLSMWVCGCVGVWECGCVAVWECGCVAVWVCGDLHLKLSLILLSSLLHYVSLQLITGWKVTLVSAEERGRTCRTHTPSSMTSHHSSHRCQITCKCCYTASGQLCVLPVVVLILSLAVFLT